MILKTASKNAYTNAPEQHPNLVLGSLQLLFWLFFHPSAWRNHVSRVDSSLEAEVTLLKYLFNHSSQRNPKFGRFLIQVLVILPLLLSLVKGGVAQVFGFPTYEGTSENLSFFYIFLNSFTFSLGLNLLALFTFGLGPALGGYAGYLTNFGSMAGISFGIMGYLVGSLTSDNSPRTSQNIVGSTFVGILFGTLICISIYFGIHGPEYSVSPDEYSDLLRITFIIGLISFIVMMLQTNKWIISAMFGVLLGSNLAILFYLPENTTFLNAVYSLILSVLQGLIFSLTFILTRRIVNIWAGSVAATLGCAIGSCIYTLISYESFSQYSWLVPRTFQYCLFVLLGFSFFSWKSLLLYPFTFLWNLFLYKVDEWHERFRFNQYFLHYNSAFWDEHQRLPLIGLDSHIVLVAECDPAEGQAAIEYLSTSSQRWAAQAAQIELDARHLERCDDAINIGRAFSGLSNVGELESPVSALLRSFNRISEDVDAALNQTSAYNQRLALTAVADRLDGLLRELTRSSDRYAVRFRPIAQRWCHIIALELEELAKTAELRQEIDSPYIIGVPLTERQAIFVGRTNISSHVEQLLLDRLHPPLLLYGQRRTGKTSLLNNLGRLLPNNVIPMFVDLQGPASRASDHAGFLYNLAKGMTDSAKKKRGLDLPPLPHEALIDDPFTRFDEWLADVESDLQGNTALLELDEFEALDQALSEGRFSETAVLGMLRNLIQHRLCFKVLLSGSHTLEEFQRWSNYLINVQVLHLGYLKDSEARQLIEHPIEGFALRYEPDASQRVLDLTRGHPFLVQLLCAEIVALKNEQDPSVRRLATLADVEAAIPEALSSGSMFFSDIERNQVDTNARSVLHFLAAQGEGATVNQTALSSQFPDNWTEAINLLLKREVIEPTKGGYRFQVELIRRWFTR